MPRIDDAFLDSVLYFYPSANEAEAGDNVGGSGLMVGIQSKVFENRWYTYAVTNSHVLREGGCQFIRANTAGRKFQVIETKPEHWHHHSDGDDIAVCPILLPPDTFTYRLASRADFLTKERISEMNIGPGDDVFMVGRFIGHDGKQRNTPSVRFGNIAMMPLEPLLHERGHKQESFLVEARSLPGYSGSPVFVWSPSPTARPGSGGYAASFGPWLLGIDWCHLRSKEPVREKGHDDPPIHEGWFVYSNSGMAGVIPVWKLEELLDIEQLKVIRGRSEQYFIEEKSRVNTSPDIRPPSSPKPDSQSLKPEPDRQ